jgi:hypothetical protein
MQLKSLTTEQEKIWDERSDKCAVLMGCFVIYLSLMLLHSLYKIYKKSRSITDQLNWGQLVLHALAFFLYAYFYAFLAVLHFADEQYHSVQAQFEDILFFFSTIFQIFLAYSLYKLASLA